MLSKSTLLLYYKRKEIQDAILASSENKEVVARFGQGFGKRPDVLAYQSDILELVKQGATSFHSSEEIWNNPLQLEPILNRKELDNLRSGWDLVLDIDCKDWEFSKLTTYLFIKAIKEHNIDSISCKFSGNKGFHIGVPFEAFPKELDNKSTKNLFPEGPRKIAQYLLSIISEKYVEVKNNQVIIDKNHVFRIEELKEKFGDKEFIIKKCRKCNKKIEERSQEKSEFICPKCEIRIKDNKEFMECNKCKILMKKLENKTTLCECGSNEYDSKFDPLSIIEVDTILIASRHLYRSDYSLNEKSGLASITFNPINVLNFNKIIAQPQNVKISKFKFLNRENIKQGEAEGLIKEAFDHQEKKEEIKTETKFKYDEIKEALPEQFFPPCIKKILQGIGDGKKRALFILVNFLTSVGWGYEKIEERLKEWNKNNKETLREVYLIGQLRYHKTHKTKVLPPNCLNKMYYQDLQICLQDELCKKIKNPVNYSRRKTFYLNKTNKKPSKKQAL
jgi:hypothetical protein